MLACLLARRDKRTSTLIVMKKNGKGSTATVIMMMVMMMMMRSPEIETIGPTNNNGSFDFHVSASFVQQFVVGRSIIRPSVCPSVRSFLHSFIHSFIFPLIEEWTKWTLEDEKKSSLKKYREDGNHHRFIV